MISQLMPPILTALMRSGEIATRARRKAEEQLNLLENEIKTGNKLFEGKGMGFVDIVGVVVAYWVPVIQQAAGKELLVQKSYPRICSWANRLLTCNVTREKLPPRDKLVSFYEDRIAAILKKASRL